MSSSDSLFLTLTRTAAVAGLGWGFGLTNSLPVWTTPSLYHPATGINAEQRLRFWSRIYDVGRQTQLVLIPSVTTLLAYSAYAANKAISYLPSNFIGRHRKSILALAATLTFSVIPFTVLAMEKLNWKLKAVEVKLDNEKPTSATSSSPTTSSANDTSLTLAQADSLIRGKWSTLHTVRVALFSSAFALALGELAFA
ncbi:hypothetical protein JCM11641_005764 [Rhodosporidiobolus odoratus]